MVVCRNMGKKILALSTAEGPRSLKKELAGWKTRVLWLDNPCRTFRFCLFTDKDERSFSFLPGQYIHLSFPKRGILSHAKKFTIVSSSEEKNILEFCVKDIDEWTGTLKTLLTSLQDGTETVLHAKISQPRGNFSYSRASGTGRFVFIAAGMGINPFISMIRSMAWDVEVQRVLLLWENDTIQDLWAGQELAQLCQQNTGLRFVPILSHDPLWTGERGRIGEEILDCYIPVSFGMNIENFEWNSLSYWICGPKSFRRNIKGLLKERRVARAALHEQDFIV